MRYVHEGCSLRDITALLHLQLQMRKPSLKGARRVNTHGPCDQRTVVLLMVHSWLGWQAQQLP